MLLRRLFAALFISFSCCTFAQAQAINTAERSTNLSIQSAYNNISPTFTFTFEKVMDNFKYATHLRNFPTETIFVDLNDGIQRTMPQLLIPQYTQGKFCDFEDYINRNNKIRIDFSVK